ncbi:MAG TPA: hypothetical protein VHP55_00765, partial [Usitatibacter sp.]|nr:hypothetical protein [Usitatibacter sp.]
MAPIACVRAAAIFLLSWLVGSAAAGNLLSNPGFESGTASWTQSSSGGFSVIYTDGAHAHTGNGYAWLGGYVSGTDTISQNVTIPAAAQQATLQFWYDVETDETTTSTAYDTLKVSVTDLAAGSTTTLGAISNLNKGGWQMGSAYDLSSLRGRTVRITLSATNDSSNVTTFFIDDMVLSEVESSTPAVAAPPIAAGYNRTCAVTSTGGALCWGDNEGGALGISSFVADTIPRGVVGLSSGAGAIVTSPSSGHVCAITSARGLVCWGDNADGQLGNGTFAPSTVPAPVTGLASGVKAVATGGYHTCALTSAGQVLCWGDDA